MGAVLFCLGVVIYLIPSWIAWSRRHRNQGAIGVLNILLGWTVIGWIGALIWSCTSNVEPSAMPAAAVKPVPCPYCAEPIHPAARRCKHCQAELGTQPRRCGDCGREVGTAEKYCPTCGFNLD